MDRVAFALLNDYQRDFPLVSRPFSILARDCGTSEAEVLCVLRGLQASGAVSRIGAVVAPGCLGASTLSALAVPPPLLAAVAEAISALPEVNHNYEREHRYNLWFVTSARDRRVLADLLAGIEATTGLKPLDLPLVTEYRIDLGFALSNACDDRCARSSAARGKPPVLGTRAFSVSPPVPRAPEAVERRLLNALNDGLEIVPQPFRVLAEALGLGEAQVLAALDRSIADGIVRRFGVIVRHHELGYRANAMAVWDVPDARVDACGRAAARVPGVTLAYRRRRQPPDWNYNLYCMVHGRERGHAEARLRQVAAAAQLTTFPHAVLFSARRFKQRGAHHRNLEATERG